MREYIEHRLEREQQILEAIGDETKEVIEIVRTVYAGYPESLYPAAGQSVTSHLVKLEAENRVLSAGHSVEGGGVLEAYWKRR